MKEKGERDGAFSCRTEDAGGADIADSKNAIRSGSGLDRRKSGDIRLRS